MSVENNPLSGDMAYHGRILKGDFSPAIKARLESILPVFQAFDRADTPVIHYISAWQGDEKNIWYEFVSQQFLDLMGCDHPHQVAEVFRKTIIDRRIYKYWGVDTFVEEEVTSRTEIDGAREMLRAESEKTGFIEAVYQLDIQPEPAIWIKDQAKIESYPQDRTALSLGCLTLVTKEMATEEERQRLAEEKRELGNQLQQSYRLDALGNLASGIAEDLNQRVAGIQQSIAELATGVSKNAFDDLSPFQHYQKLKRIESHLKEVNDLSKQLMAFSGKGPYDFMDVDLTEVVQVTLNEFDFGDKPVKIRAAYCPELHRVKADRAFFGRALYNLFQNAAQALEKGGTLFLKTDNTVLEKQSADAWGISPGEYISIVIELRNMVLSEKDKQRIFEPFYTSGGSGRTGLSLATAYGIIKKHDGIVTVADNPEGGTSFSIYLPRGN